MSQDNLTISNGIATLYKIIVFNNIPFIFIAVLILMYYLHALRVKIRQRNIPDYNTGNEKAGKINILVHKFIFVMLLIELSTNTTAIITGMIYGFDPQYDQKIIPPLNSCRTNPELDFQLRNYSKGWFSFLPAMVNFSITQFLQPTVSLLLNVLRRAYLDYPYRNIIKRWMYIILIRGCILFLLLSYYQTVYIGISILPIFYIVDFIIYIKSSRSFYSLLKSRMEVARLHSSRREYRDKYRVLHQYRVTSAYTTLTFFILTLKNSLYGTLLFINGSIRTFCLMNSITLGYSPLIFYSTTTIKAVFNFSFYFFAISRCLDSLYQALISLAYLLVCVGIGIRVYRRTERFNQINRSINRLVTHYHRTLD